MCNLYAGGMSYLALGKPKHLPVDATVGLRTALRATSENAVAMYGEGIRVMLRNPARFRGRLADALLLQPN